MKSAPFFALSVLLLSAVFVSGCARFDPTKIPLYDEVIYPPVEEDQNMPRRSPAGNPLDMPPGYKKPEFKNNPPQPGATLELMQEQNAATELNPVYPDLTTVPPTPKIMSNAKRDETIETLQEQRSHAASIQHSIVSGEGVPHGEIALQNAVGEETQSLPATLAAAEEMPWKELSEGVSAKQVTPFDASAGVRQPIKPLTLLEPSAGGDDAIYDPQSMEAAPIPAGVPAVPGEMTHEFGTPVIEQGMGHSAVTLPAQAGFASPEAMREQDAQLRLPPFRYTDVPEINALKVPPVAQKVSFGNQDPPLYLPESRYRDRARTGYYTGNYYGHSYFKNQN